MMIMQHSCYVVDCPICGRPVELQRQYVGQEIVCGHCHGHFVVSKSEEDGLKAARLDGLDLLERAEQLLHRAGKADRSASSGRCRRLPQAGNDVNRLEKRCGTALEGGNCKTEPPHTALLVEHRDEVFARIATDMAKAGLCVVRAKSATEALKLCGTYDPTLVVANLDQPDQSGWLLAGKLRFVDRRIRVWLYRSQATHYGEGMASYLHVDELLDYGGDLLGLSETIIGLMTDRRWAEDSMCDKKEKPTPATA